MQDTSGHDHPDEKTPSAGGERMEDLPGHKQWDVRLWQGLCGEDYQP